MNDPASTAFADPELAELFAEEPELLAIADAITVTTPAATVTSVPPFGRRLIRRLLARTPRSLAIAVVFGLVAAVPALAFSAGVRGLLGIDGKRSAPAPRLQAAVTAVTVQRRRVGAMATVTFTVGAPAKPAGTAVPAGSVFFVSMLPKHGRPTPLIKANGARGVYHVTAWIPRGGIRSIQVGGWLNLLPIPTAAGGFWIPVMFVVGGY